MNNRSNNINIDVLNKNSSVHEEEALKKVTELLFNDQPAAESRVEKSLKERLLQRYASAQHETADSAKAPGFHHVPSRQFKWVMAGIASIIALYGILFLSVPEVQAATRNLIIRIGNLLIDNDPTDAELYVATMTSGTPTATVDPNKVCEDCRQVQVAGLLSVEQAGENAGFPVFEAAYIPDGYELVVRDVLDTDETITVDTSYRMELDPPLHNGEMMSAIIAIEQTYFKKGSPVWESSVGDVPIVEVTVRGYPGIWLEQVPIYPFQDENGDWNYANWNQLIWAEDGYNMMIQTNMPSNLLPLSELQKIAESLE